MISLIALAKAAAIATALTAAPTSSVSAVAAAPPGLTFTVDNLTGIHTKPLALTNGLCMYVPNANPGTHVYLGNCSNTNQWSYFSSGQLSPEGHDNVGVADSGGEPVLKAEPTTVIDSDSVKIGNTGYSYFELLMTGKLGSLPHNYLHNNGNGNAIGGDNEMGDLANYYALNAD